MDIFSILGMIFIGLIVLKIVWTTWRWVLDVNSDRELNKMRLDFINKRVDRLQEAEYERQRRERT